ncbi:MAG TPA: SEC-C domain-containing protein [Bryobacteraceae bacterium]|jgi:hypothetical protein|nr:SEC-C domain-containing protein [Bryobacteraceae bacterium]
MLFPTESIFKARQNLVAQLHAGTLTTQEAAQRALELDSFDSLSLAVAGAQRFEAGDLVAAAEYSWRAASANPCRAEPWFQLLPCLPNETQALRNGIMELGAAKALRDPEGIARFEERFKESPEAANYPSGEAFLETTRAGFNEMRRDEPVEVSERLRPHRLIDDLLEWAPDGLDEELVDAILEEGARATPLLIGVLRAMATESLPGDDTPPTVCSLALLGEIGDPAVLPELIEFSTVEDEEIEDAANWAVGRIVERRPEESLDAIRQLIPGAEADRLSGLALALNHFPEESGKLDLLVSLLDGLANFPKPERHDVFMAVVVVIAFSGGDKNRELAWSLLSRHAGLLPKRTRAEFRETLRLRDGLDRLVALESANSPSDSSDDSGDAPGADPGADPGTTVYDLCSHPSGEDDEEEEEEEDDEDDEDDGTFDEEEEDEDDIEDEADYIPEPIRRSVTPGRNDPCWCGSGKKYKKCHLEADEKGQRAPHSAE